MMQGLSSEQKNVSKSTKAGDLGESKTAARRRPVFDADLRSKGFMPQIRRVYP